MRREDKKQWWMLKLYRRMKEWWSRQFKVENSWMKLSSWRSNVIKTQGANWEKWPRSQVPYIAQWPTWHPNCDWINWGMNVPQASHMGGSQKSKIRTARSVLWALLLNHGRQLDDESLRMLLIEAEAIVKSRPCAIDDLTASVDVLTPNRLPTIKTSVVFTPPGNFQNADVYSRKLWRLLKKAVKSNISLMRFGSSGKGATFSPFRADKNGPPLRETLK